MTTLHLGSPASHFCKRRQQAGHAPLAGQALPASGGVPPGSSEQQAPHPSAACTPRPGGARGTATPLREGVPGPGGAQDAWPGALTGLDLTGASTRASRGVVARDFSRLCPLTAHSVVFTAHTGFK